MENPLYSEMTVGTAEKYRSIVQSLTFFLLPMWKCPEWRLDWFWVRAMGKHEKISWKMPPSVKTMYSNPQEDDMKEYALQQSSWGMVFGFFRKPHTHGWRLIFFFFLQKDWAWIFLCEIHQHLQTGLKLLWTDNMKARNWLLINRCGFNCRCYQ